MNNKLLFKKTNKIKSVDLEYNYKIMQFMGELVAGADHEINNLLMMIEGSSKIIVDDSLTVEHKQLAIDALATKTKRIKEIMFDLRSVLKDGSSDKIRTYNIRDLINKSISLCKTRFKNHRIFFQLNISEDLRIEGKETQLLQSLLSVLTSSHDAIVHHQDRWIKVSVIEQDEAISIIVKDSGNPLNEHDKENMYNPLYETDDGRTGVGLSMAKGIIEAHKGVLSIGNSVEGTPQVWISLPKLQPHTATVSLKENRIIEEVEIYDQKINRINQQKKAA
jgi:signal transduction histidine kinase